MEIQRIGKLIAQLRKEQGYTQRELAQRLSVTDKAVSRWETGKGLPDTGTLKQLSEELGISVGELLAGERIEEKERTEKSDAILLEALQYSKRRLAGMVNGALLASGILLLFTPLVTVEPALGVGLACLGGLLAAISLLRMILGRRGIRLQLEERTACWISLSCLAAALALELLPFGAVLNFVRPDGPPFRQNYSYFSPIPFGYANFAPLITGILTIAVLLLSVLCLAKKNSGTRLRNGVFVLSLVTALLSLGPLLLGSAYMSAVSYGITGLLAASAVFQAVANRRIP